MLCSGQQATTNHPPLLGRAVSAHLQQRKPLSTFPSPFFLFVWVFFHCCLKFQARNKAGRHAQADGGLLSSSQGARALASRCYLWAEAMQAIHISSEGHSQGGIKRAVPPSVELCVTHGRDRLVWGAALKYSLGRGVAFVTE